MADDNTKAHRARMGHAAETPFVRLNQPSTRQELADVLRDECGQTPINDDRTLIDSLPARVRKVIQAKG